jgi:hypothetical protein
MSEFEGKIPKINIITCRGEKTWAYADSQPKIEKETPKNDRYDPLKTKLFFKYAIEIFVGVSAP